MKKTLLTGIAALLLATGTAHAETKCWSTKCWWNEPLPDRAASAGAVACAGGVEIATEPPTCFGPNRELQLDWVRKEREKLLPPPEFDHEYIGKIRIIRTDEAGVRAGCRITSVNGGRLACASHTADTCVIYMLDDKGLQIYGWDSDIDIIVRHERGHCNGWRHHPPASKAN